MGLFKDPKSQHSYYVFCLLNLYKFEKFEDPSDRCADTICRDHITVFSFPHRPKKLFSISTRDNPRGLCEVSPMRLAAAVSPDVHSEFMVFPGYKLGSLQIVDLATTEHHVSSAPVTINAHQVWGCDSELS